MISFLLVPPLNNNFDSIILDPKRESTATLNFFVKKLFYKIQENITITAIAATPKIILTLPPEFNLGG